MTNELKLELQKILIKKKLAKIIGDHNNDTLHYTKNKQSIHVKQLLHHLVGAKDDVLKENNQSLSTPNLDGFEKSFDQNSNTRQRLKEIRDKYSKSLAIKINKKIYNLSENARALLETLKTHKLYIYNDPYKIKILNESEIIKLEQDNTNELELSQIIAVKLYELIYGYPLQLEKLTENLNKDILKKLTEIIQEELFDESVA